MDENYDPSEEIPMQHLNQDYDWDSTRDTFDNNEETSFQEREEGDFEHDLIKQRMDQRDIIRRRLDRRARQNQEPTPLEVDEPMFEEKITVDEAKEFAEEKIENQQMRARVLQTLDDISSNIDIDIIEMKRIFIESCDAMDENDGIEVFDPSWMETSFIEDVNDREIFLWEQKVANLNQMLRNFTDAYIDPDNGLVKDYIQENVTEEVRDGKIRGYRFKGDLICLLDEYDVYEPIRNQPLLEFGKSVGDIQNKRAKSSFVQKLRSRDQNIILRSAEEYIREMRESRKEAIRKEEHISDLKRWTDEVIDELNRDERVIEAIKKNGKFQWNAKIFARTFASSLGQIFRFIRKHPRVFGSIFLSLVGSLLSSIITLYATGRLVGSVASTFKKAVEKNINEGSKNLDQKIGESVKNIKKDIDTNMSNVKKDFHDSINHVQQDIHDSVQNVKEEFISGKEESVQAFENLFARFSGVLIGGSIAITGLVVIKKWTK